MPNGSNCALFMDHSWIHIVGVFKEITVINVQMTC